MTIMLTPQGEELLREALDRHPGESAATLIERALAERAAREVGTPPSGSSPPPRSAEQITAFFDALAAGSDKIPTLPTDAFSRESIYQDHA
jgi:hypothetical protein